MKILQRFKIFVKEKTREQFNYMVIYKFGGASVKDSDGVRNLLKILTSQNEARIVVVSAFGKTTNNLEELTGAIYQKNHEKFRDKLGKLKDYHLSIVRGLFKKDHPVYNDVEEVFEHLGAAFTEEWDQYDRLYDQVVCLGEILSTKVIAAYLDEQGLGCQWVDIRAYLVTDSIYREASVRWDDSLLRIKSLHSSSGKRFIVTQGFIGGTLKGESTTLGREGSDYTAAVLANMLDAEKVVIWKDVPGVMNADPRYFGHVEKLRRISFQEAIELAYYGAKILHPKTIKPLQNKEIPLYVNSFLEPESTGTLITGQNVYDEEKPIFILKKDQILISIIPRDFSFVFEEMLSKIYNLFAKYRISVNLMQHSAINFTFCADEKNKKVFELIEDLRQDFKVLYNSGLDLLTIRHYNEQVLKDAQKGRQILVEQRSRHTAQFLFSPS